MESVKKGNYICWNRLVWVHLVMLWKYVYKSTVLFFNILLFCLKEYSETLNKISYIKYFGYTLDKTMSFYFFHLAWYPILTQKLKTEFKPYRLYIHRHCFQSKKWINDTDMEELVLYWMQYKMQWNTRLATPDVCHMFTQSIKFF